MFDKGSDIKNSHKEREGNRTQGNCATVRSPNHSAMPDSEGEELVNSYIQNKRQEVELFAAGVAVC